MNLFIKCFRTPKLARFGDLNLKSGVSWQKCLKFRPVSRLGAKLYKKFNENHL